MKVAKSDMALGVVLGLYLFAFGYGVYITNVKKTHSHTLDYLVLAFVACVSIACVFLQRKWAKAENALKSAGFRPVVRVCEHNGDTIFVSDPVYQAAKIVREELQKLYSGGKIRARPAIFAYRSLSRCDGGLEEWQVKALRDSCSFEETKMQICIGDGAYTILDFEQMWKHLHGPDAKVPEKPEPKADGPLPGVMWG